MKKELKRAILNPYFILICLYGIVIALLHCGQKASEYNTFISAVREYSTVKNVKMNPHAPIYNAFSLWIGCDSSSKFSKLLFFIFPLLATLPYSWSYCYNYKKEKNKNECFNPDSHQYLAVFISSGLTLAIPLLINFLSILFFIPAIFPDSVYDIYYGFFSNEFMSYIFYVNPYLYILIFIILCFVFSGLLGCLGFSFSTLIRSRILAITFPFIVTLATEYIKRHIGEKNDVPITEFSPMSFLFPAKSHNASWMIIISEMIALFIITYVLAVLRFKFKKDSKEGEVKA